ncbi:MAG: YibE/F family protein, partial [Microlunatus sp.]|nr:YibE/F family protein [Microlunatus sp.]
MTHTHSPDTTQGRVGGTPTRGRGDAGRQRRALRILIVVLIPLGIWTVAGLIALWPKDVAAHINADVAGYSIAGVTYPTGKITAIKPLSCEGLAGSTPGVSTQTCANITVSILDGDDTGKEVVVPLTDALFDASTKVGQRVVLIRIPPIDGQPSVFQFSDFERRLPLAAITIAFAVAVIAVARWRGFAALLGLGFAGFVMVKFIFPALVSGSNPLLVGLIGSSAIMFVVLYAAHGISARTSTALVGTLSGLVVAALLGWGATRWAYLSGVSAEDDYVLAAAAPDLSLSSVLICGIIIASLGVLNDVTITQASAVWELADADPDQKRLFSKAMRIGRDHIASTVYTIAFVTAGASLPVLLLIAIYDRPMLQVLQTEQFAAELIRTMVGSIGLVLAVPLTTAIGVAVVRASRHARVAVPTVPGVATIQADDEAPSEPASSGGPGSGGTGSKGT